MTPKEEESIRADLYFVQFGATEVKQHSKREQKGKAYYGNKKELRQDKVIEKSCLERKKRLRQKLWRKLSV